MTVPTAPAPADNASAAVRDHLTDALRLDLIGPRPAPQDADLQDERLDQAPSRWYLTGFLVPSKAPADQRGQDADEALDDPAEPIHGGDDAPTPERATGKRLFWPSSMGLSLLVDEATARLDVTVSWGDYRPEAEAGGGAGASAPPVAAASAGADSAASNADAPTGGSDRRRGSSWVRQPKRGRVAIELAGIAPGVSTSVPVPDGDGLEIACLVRPTQAPAVDGPVAARAVSVFVVNRRAPHPSHDGQDVTFAFQVELRVAADRPLIPRRDLRGYHSDDWDDRLADLHYRDVAEYAVGHNVSTRADLTADGECRAVHTEWMPQAAVPRVESSTDIRGVEFGMEALGALADPAAARRRLDPLVRQYREWIEGQRTAAAAFTGRRREVADKLVGDAARAADRMAAGVALLADPDVLEAFRLANRAMAAAARRRQAQEAGAARPDQVAAPAWRPFQLAFLLMNLKGIAEPASPDREMVDLLFFPTGGGKTEAYLGLSAFTLVLRRLREPDPAHRGLSVLMRYTLRLLTLDQLGRAAALICALELERARDPDRLGAWPFEIALWVGRAATPNRMGSAKDRSPHTARVKTLRFMADTSRDPPLPIEQCPWCGARFTRHSFRLVPSIDAPTELVVRCAARRCAFGPAGRPLPIVAVDETIYARLPAFMIATADKFAALPWTGETAGFFRGGDPQHPRPPDLIIQDELHLISGPLGTMAALYETAIDQLCRREVDGRTVRPKVIASTATVRLAQQQIRALFDRPTVDVFPPPGCDRRDAFFAREASGAPRRYLGLAAQGRGPKVTFLRSMTTLMAAAQAQWDLAVSAAQDARAAAGGATASASGAAAGAAPAAGAPANPADPYMTAVAYFNALRELGNARRIVEDEIGVRLKTYAGRRRTGEAAGRFANRDIAFEPVELTSRVGTAKVAEAKRRLAAAFDTRRPGAAADAGMRRGSGRSGRSGGPGRAGAPGGGGEPGVDVALATNMISVGLDITRLGLMVVSGQPKTTSEYIQATSRVGRHPARPGLVVTLLNIHKPRDRSHYERFAPYHASFYRNVEPTSVTPFSARALDRGLAAVVVALVRLGIPALTPTPAAKDVETHDAATAALAQAVAERATRHADGLPADFGDRVQARVQSLIDDWAEVADYAGKGGMTFGYSRGQGVSTPLLREMIDPDAVTMTGMQRRFRAPRSLRDVEPGVLLAIKSPTGTDLK